MDTKEFKEYVKENDDNITRFDGYKNNKLNNFKVFCKKCGSGDVIIETDFDYSMGSEYTGIYGEEVKMLFKCNSCGSAEEVIE